MPAGRGLAGTAGRGAGPQEGFRCRWGSLLSQVCCSHGCASLWEGNCVLVAVSCSPEPQDRSRSCTAPRWAQPQLVPAFGGELCLAKRTRLTASLWLSQNCPEPFQVSLCCLELAKPQCRLGKPWEANTCRGRTQPPSLQGSFPAPQSQTQAWPSPGGLQKETDTFYFLAAVHKPTSIPLCQATPTQQGSDTKLVPGPGETPLQRPAVWLSWHRPWTPVGTSLAAAPDSIPLFLLFPGSECSSCPLLPHPAWPPSPSAAG